MEMQARTDEGRLVHISKQACLLSLFPRGVVEARAMRRMYMYVCCSPIQEVHRSKQGRGARPA